MFLTWLQKIGISVPLGENLEIFVSYKSIKVHYKKSGLATFDISVLQT